LRYPHSKVNELQGFFKERYSVIRAGCKPSSADEFHGDPDEIWTVFLNRLDCLIVDEDDLVESFPDMVNFGAAVKTHVCLNNPSGFGFLLVPPELAEKALVMGGLA